MVKVYCRIHRQALEGKLKYTLISFLLQLVCHVFEHIFNFTFVTMKLQFSINTNIVGTLHALICFDHHIKIIALL